MKKLSVDVYYDKNRFGYDCTNGGVTSRHTSLTLFWDCSKQEALKHCEENVIDTDAALWLNPRQLWGEYLPIAEPLICPKGKIGPMFGGNFIYTSDSRFPHVSGNYGHYPIPVHDRFETQEQYDSLSR
jgi:hypothetical protein